MSGWCPGCLGGGEHVRECYHSLENRQIRATEAAGRVFVSTPPEPTSDAAAEYARAERHHDIVCVVLKTLLAGVTGEHAVDQRVVDLATGAARLYADALYPEAK